ncbi:unnamed protein product, partial [Strongylus vulgaris]
SKILEFACIAEWRTQGVRDLLKINQAVLFGLVHHGQIGENGLNVLRHALRAINREHGRVKMDPIVLDQTGNCDSANWQVALIGMNGWHGVAAPLPVELESANGVGETNYSCITDDLLNLPNLEELDESLFEVDTTQAGWLESARRAPVRTIEGGGTCIGTDVERKPCDAVNGANGPRVLAAASKLFLRETANAQLWNRVQCSSHSQPRSNVTCHCLCCLLVGSPLTMTPIVPVNHRIRRQAIYSQRGAQCCEGDAVETRPCNIHCETPAPCTWTEWSEWCGCARCRAGKESRRRFCDRAGTTSGLMTPDPSCRCAGKDFEERDCIVERVSFTVE